MDPTQRFDPNRTQLTGGPAGSPIGSPPGFPVDPLKTQAIGAFDPLKTQAIGAFNPTGSIASGRGLVAEVIAGREATMANGPAREQFLLELFGGTAGPALPGLGVAGARTPLNICLVIDRSGSMEGTPLEYVKQACSYVVDMLNPTDVLSIVTFEETVDVLMPPQRVTSKQPIKDGIQRLMPGNTTNLYDGLALGAQQVLMANESNRATRLVVLTDGDPTAGIKDFSALVAHAGEIKGRGITITFLGFGPDYNEELLASMAKRAGGNYYFIPRPELIPEVFRTELEKLMTVSARSLSLRVKPARWVTMRSPQTSSGAEIEIALADIERGGSIQQVFDFEFANHPLGWYRVASGKLSYDDLVTGSNETLDIDFVIEFTADAARYSVPQDPRVAGAAQVMAASRVVEKTVMGLKTGMITQMGAITELQKTQMMLTAQGRTAEAQEVTMALRALQSGDSGQAEKTLMGTMLGLDQGRSK